MRVILTAYYNRDDPLPQDFRAAKSLQNQSEIHKSWTFEPVQSWEGNFLAVDPRLEWKVDEHI